MFIEILFFLNKKTTIFFLKLLFEKLFKCQKNYLI